MLKRSPPSSSSVISAMDSDDHFADDEMEIEVQTRVIKKKLMRVKKSHTKDYQKKLDENQFHDQSQCLWGNSKTDDACIVESNQNLRNYKYSPNIQRRRRQLSKKQRSFSWGMKCTYRNDYELYTNCMINTNRMKNEQKKLMKRKFRCSPIPELPEEE
ncbi:hypothetical protein T4D_2427 [Trichinella pseudospiralis]|uniref:Uncharacterized protein n=1 Tax=Trichinella pseudospiralis TaxID=6337 RepID=A0A0V1G4T3_TRIPS|nr:hypothetical protein T4D_2427 [Trichinella pseudospiralis]